MDAISTVPSPQPQAQAVPLLRALVLCDLVESTRLLERLGDQRAADLFRKHDRLVRALLQAHAGREIDKTDGFLVMFERPPQAVAFAFAYQRSLRQLGTAENVALAARIGIHVGDVLSWDNAPDEVANGAKLVEVEGLAKPLTARLMQLALPNQILLSGVAYALTHRAHAELGVPVAALRWRAHGRYRFKGLPDPVAVFEVGEDGHAPLKSPPWSGKAHREVPFWRRPVALAVEAVALLALVAIPAWYLLKPAPAIAFAQRDWVVVGDLNNLTDEPAFNESVGSAFRIGLEQSRYVNVLSDLKVRQTVGRMQRDPNQTPIDRVVGSEVAMRDGARALILPTLAEIGGRVRVTAEVIDPNTQATVWSESADGVGENSVMSSLDQVSRRLRQRLGEALATVSHESRPLEKVATKNLDALRAYSLGISAYVKGDSKQAIGLFRQAIKIDPDFALARLHLGDALITSSAGDNTEAISEVRKAISLSDQLSTRDALYAQAWLANFENPRAALDKWRVLAKLYPDFTPATGALGFFSYNLENNFSAAIAAIELNAVEKNPNRSGGDYLLATLYTGNERYEDARRRFELAKENGFSTQGIYWSYLYAAQRRFDQVDRILIDSQKSDDAATDALFVRTRVTFALDRGEWNRANEFVRKEAAKEQSSEFMLIDLGLHALTDPLDEQRTALADYVKSATNSKTRATPSGQFHLLFAAYLAAHAGATDLAQAALSGVASISTSGDYPYLSSLFNVVEAELARVNGQPGKTIELLQPRMDGTEYYFSHRVLMDAHAARGDYAHALAEAQWLARHRGRAYVEQFGQAILRPFNVALSDLALMDAAELSFRLNKPDVARRFLVDLRQAWPDADKLPFLKQRLKVLDAGLGSSGS